MPDTADKILILSEDQSLINTLLSDIGIAGCTASGESPYEVKVESILRQSPSLILFDFALCNADILRIYQVVKGNSKLQNQGISVIVLVSEDNLSSLPPTLEFDALVALPYKLCELEFKIKYLIWRRYMASGQEIIRVEDMTVNLASYEVLIGGERIDFAFKEYELFKYLITHRGRAFDRESLLNVIWGYNYYGGTRTVDVHIRRIRAKIGDIEGEYIKTVRGVGYMFKL